MTVHAKTLSRKAAQRAKLFAWAYGKTADPNTGGPRYPVFIGARKV
jgi:hypothetical protein